MQPPTDREAEVSRKPWPLRSAPDPSLRSGRAETASFECTAVAPVSTGNPAGSLSSSQDELAQAALGLLTEMEASLQGSQKAVLSGNGPMLERCTREQVRLHRALEVLLAVPAWPGTTLPTSDLITTEPTNVRAAVPRSASVMAAEVLSAARRVLHGARVQAALLRRARQFRRVFSNLAAAQGATYAVRFGECVHL